MKRTRQAPRNILVSQRDVYDKVDNNVFDGRMAGRKVKFRATNNIIQYVLDVESQKKKILVL